MMQLGNKKLFGRIARIAKSKICFADFVRPISATGCERAISVEAVGGAQGRNRTANTVSFT
jgi:hypothetical protein